MTDLAAVDLEYLGGPRDGDVERVSAVPEVRSIPTPSGHGVYRLTKDCDTSGAVPRRFLLWKGVAA